jgi:hypothetical protein
MLCGFCSDFIRLQGQRYGPGPTRQGNDSTRTDTTRRGKGGQRCGLTEIEAADLPTAVTSFISSTYTGASIEPAGKTDQNQVIVQIKKADGTQAASFWGGWHFCE